jgi:hypothetical protein
MQIKMCRHKQRRYKAKLARIELLAYWVEKGRKRALV